MTPLPNSKMSSRARTSRWPCRRPSAASFIAREDISAYRKDVTTGLYGGDVSRKKKVLAKQAKGKKRMKRFGKVDIPAEAFTVMLKRD